MEIFDQLEVNNPRQDIRPEYTPGRSRFEQDKDRLISEGEAIIDNIDILHWPPNDAKCVSWPHLRPIMDVDVFTYLAAKDAGLGTYFTNLSTEELGPRAKEIRIFMDSSVSTINKQLLTDKTVLKGIENDERAKAKHAIMSALQWYVDMPKEWDELTPHTMRAWLERWETDKKLHNITPPLEPLRELLGTQALDTMLMRASMTNALKANLRLGADDIFHRIRNKNHGNRGKNQGDMLRAIEEFEGMGSDYEKASHLGLRPVRYEELYNISKVLLQYYIEIDARFLSPRSIAR